MFAVTSNVSLTDVQMAILDCRGAILPDSTIAQAQIRRPFSSNNVVIFYRGQRKQQERVEHSDVRQEKLEVELNNVCLMRIAFKKLTVENINILSQGESWCA